MENKEYDLIIIGAGPGGYTAALDAAGRGLKTAIIEKDKVGGTCLFEGCIPTKTLLHTAGLYTNVRNGQEIGLEADHVRVNMDRLQQYKDSVIRTLSDGIKSQLSRRKAGLYLGEGQISSFPENDGSSKEGRFRVTCGQTMLCAPKVLIASGTEPSRLPVPGADLPGVYNSTGMLQVKTIPSSLVIIGGGVIGIEFACLYSQLGTKVTILEALEKILSNMDREFGQSLKVNLKQSGVDIHTGASLQKIRQENGRLVCCYTEKEELHSTAGEMVLVAVGRRAATKQLFAESLAGKLPEMQKGRLVVDEFQQTSVPGLYAIGDVCACEPPLPALAHVASAQGLNAVAAMQGRELPIHMKTVPSCVYTSPEIASCGMTLEEAKAAGIKAQSWKYVMSANGKTVLTRQGRGFIKIITDQDGTIIGCQMMCANATDMIGEFVNAVGQHETLRQMAGAIRPHPTFNEAVWELVRTSIE